MFTDQLSDTIQIIERITELLASGSDLDSLFEGEINELHLTPPEDYQGSFPLGVQVEATESDSSKSYVTDRMEVTIGLQGDDVIHLLGTEHGPTDELANDGDSPLALEDKETEVTEEKMHYCSTPIPQASSPCTTAVNYSSRMW